MTYFPRRETINSHVEWERLQFVHGFPEEERSHLMRRALQYLQATLARVVGWDMTTVRQVQVTIV